MSKGIIWPEYWIDCCECDHHQPLATSKSPAAAARKQGWRRKGNAYSGAWVCPECLSLGTQTVVGTVGEKS